MPRRLRVHVPGGFYHVTLRGNHQQDVFVAEDDRHLLNRIVARALGTFDARLHAYCWMSNHLHLLVQVGIEPLAGPMRNIASEFARAMQGQLETTGHFFERRYHAKLVDVDSYFKELVRYIHLNPVRAGVVADAAEFLWSSHHAYVGARHEPWVTTDVALSLFGGTRTSAIGAYRGFLGEDGALDWAPGSQTEEQVSLREDDFTSRAANAPVVVIARQSLGELIAEACGRFEVQSARLDSPVRDAYWTKVRAWIASQAVRRGVASLSAVARVTGRSEATLREAIRKYPGEVE